ncbi:MAG TPA: GNAT family N-acetyltransferase [Chthonomonadaceae bacterium]|nr:GNAT family N-acetyltransferase [Chthonomonadaceae bacterium]
MIEGPRAVRKEEFETLRPLTDVVFRPDMMDEYPQLFNEDNLENLRVCVDEGRCVSHVGMTERTASLFGCQVKTCCIGAVSTLPEYRKQGLASACFDDAANKAFHDGVDFMIVSGDRNLYRMRGCLRVGSDTRYTLIADALPTLEAAGGRSVTVELMTEAELPRVMDCYRYEPVRFVRPLDDYGYALKCGRVMNRPAEFLVIRAQGDFRGYVIVQTPGESSRAGIVEFAGDRHAILAALPEIFRRYRVAELGWQVSRHDHLFRALCAESGLQGQQTTTAGTYKLINFPQLMERMRPRWEELLGWREAAKLSFRQDTDEYGFCYGEEEFVTDRDTATRLVFGTVERAEEQALAEAGKVAEVLKAILPLPTLWYGLNYV